MVALAKISPPSLVNVYARQRLFELLGTAHHAPATWVCGPPGAGKTTLVASYVASLNLHPVWYRMDEGDADLATFFYYQGQAAKVANPRKKKALLQFLPEHRLDLKTFSRRYFREFYGQLPEPFVVVYDNFQDIGEDSPVQEVMQYALAEIPLHGRVIVISRNKPSSRFSRLQANGLLQVIGPGNLRLSNEEVIGLSGELMPGLLQGQSVAVLLEKIQGWAAGVVLMCESFRQAERYQHLSGDASPQEIFDYFAGEILQQASPDTRDVLMTSALLPHVPKRIARELTGNDSAEVVLDDFCRRNYFTTLDGQSIYQFHPLFQEFLSTQARRQLTPGEIGDKLRVAARAFESLGQVEAAVSLWLETQDWQEAASNLLTCAPEMLAQGRHATLMRWLEKLPAAIHEDSPWLLYWHGMAALPFDPIASGHDLARAYALFQGAGDTAGFLRAWAGLAMSIWSDGSGDFKRLDPWLAELDRIIPGLSGFPSPQIEGEVAYCAFAAMFFRAPRHPMIELWRERALALSRAHANLNQNVGALVIAIHYDLMRGDNARASLSADAIAALGAREELLEPSIRIRRLGAISYYQQRTGDFQAALDSMAAGLEVVRASGVRLWDHLLYSHGINAALMLGDTGLAGSLLGLMGRDPRVTSGFVGALYHLLAAWDKQLCGDLATAQAHSATAIGIAEQSGVARGMAYLSHAQVLCKQHRLAEARGYLAKSLEIARNDANLQLEFMCLILEAHCDFTEGNQEQAYEHLRRALAIGREQQIVVSLGWDNAMMAQLCGRALQSGIEQDHVRHVIRVCKLLPSPPALENWPWRLKLYTLGRFSILKDDEPMKFAGKAPKKLIALLKAIIALGGRDVPDRSLIDALWPDLEADAAQEAFEVALRRLRKLLGEDVISVRESRVTLDDGLVWVDAWAFEHLLPGTDAAAGASGMAGLAQALELYHGAFLAGDPDAFWSLSARERLRSKFIRYSAILGKARAESGDWDSALAVYLAGIDADSLSEELYQGAMRCYQQLGRHAEALAVYRRLRQTLSIMLGIKPSATSEKLYQASASG